MSQAAPPPPPAPEPSPYESLRPEGQRPPGDSRARAGGPLGWLFGDLGLKVLAVLLAVLLWKLARGRLDETRELFVTVVLKPALHAGDGSHADEVRVRGGDERRGIKLTLRGSRDDVERVTTDLYRADRRIEHRFAVTPGPKGRIGPLSTPDRFDYPAEGASRVVTKVEPFVEAEWVRVVTRKVRVVVPKTGQTQRADVEVGAVELTDKEVEVSGPESLFQGDEALVSIQPDLVEVSPWLADNADLATPLQFQVGFRAWRAEKASDRDEALVRISPATVKGTVKFAQRSTQTLDNGVRVLLAGLDPSAYADYDIVIAPSPAYDPGPPPRMKLEVRGDPKAITKMRSEPNEWSFAIALPPPPTDDGVSKVEDVKVPVVLWFQKGVAPPSVRLAGEASVFVTLRRRDK